MQTETSQTTASRPWRFGIRQSQARSGPPALSGLVLCRLALVAAALAVAALLPGSGLQAAPLIRISTENPDSHVQTRIIASFARQLQDRLGGSFEVRHVPRAGLFRDRDVINALEQGKVEMAVPGTWQLGRFEPDFGLFLLPMFYGRDQHVNYRLRDGEIGQQLAEGLEEKVNVKVLGRWIDLGYAHLYSMDRPLKRHEDIAGLKIRAAGGPANLERLAALGATPVVIPWPDLPIALERRTVDGVLTTHATVASAALWNSGIRYAFEDRQYFPQYVPLMSRLFWNRLNDEQRRIISETWESGVDEARLAARNAQDQARQSLIDNGIEIAIPDEPELVRWREIVMKEQDRLIGILGIDEGLVSQAAGILQSGDQ